MTDDSGAPGTPKQRLEAASARLREGRRRQEQAFVPSPVIEALVLQVIGGWEQLKAYVNFCRFLHLGPDAEWVDRTGLPKTMREIAIAYRIRWPHQTWSDKAGHADKVRQKFAHWLCINRVEGDAPNRTLYFTRLGEEGESFRDKRGALGLQWRGDEWAIQKRHEDSISEQELRETLADLEWLIACCRALKRLAGILAHSPHLPDDHPPR